MSIPTGRGLSLSLQLPDNFGIHRHVILPVEKVDLEDGNRHKRVVSQPDDAQRSIIHLVRGDLQVKLTLEGDIVHGSAIPDIDALITTVKGAVQKLMTDPNDLDPRTIPPDEESVLTFLKRLRQYGNRGKELNLDQRFTSAMTRKDRLSLTMRAFGSQRIVTITDLDRTVLMPYSFVIETGQRAWYNPENKEYFIPSTPFLGQFDSSQAKIEEIMDGLNYEPHDA